jgi:tRNA (guanine10-N2)-dimethyltransferase
MKTFAFHLSGEHPTLPRSEVRSLLEICSTSCEEVLSLDSCLIVKVQDLDLAAMELRLAMTHSVIEVLDLCQAQPKSLVQAAERIELSAKRYRFRCHSREPSLKSDLVEREVGRILFKRGLKADLKDPEMELRGIITAGWVVLGKEVARPDRHSFQKRRPHLKPFFHPGVLMPRMARVLVNLSQAVRGESLLDPFAGTGGILVEACLMGIKGIGLDVQRKMVQGSRDNLTGLDCTLMLGDAKRLPFLEASLEAAVLDTPYGRSALIRARSKEALLDESLAELHRVLIPGRRMVVMADRPIETQVEASGFRILERHTHRVHRSLTRFVFACRA